MHDLVTTILMLLGAAFMLLSAVGIVRMPDLFTRLQTTSKASTLGISCIMLALAMDSLDLAIAARALAVIIFMFLTNPIAAHMIGRAAYIERVKLWEGTKIDELATRYDPQTHELKSPPRTE